MLHHPAFLPPHTSAAELARRSALTPPLCLPRLPRVVSSLPACTLPKAANDVPVHARERRETQSNDGSCSEMCQGCHGSRDRPARKKPQRTGKACVATPSAKTDLTTRSAKSIFDSPHLAIRQGMSLKMHVWRVVVHVEMGMTKGRIPKRQDRRMGTGFTVNPWPMSDDTPEYVCAS